MTARAGHKNTRQQSLLSGITTRVWCRSILDPATSLSTGTSLYFHFFPERGGWIVGGSRTSEQVQSST